MGCPNRLSIKNLATFLFFIILLKITLYRGGNEYFLIVLFVNLGFIDKDITKVAAKIISTHYHFEILYNINYRVNQEALKNLFLNHF